MTGSVPYVVTGGYFIHPQFESTLKLNQMTPFFGFQGSRTGSSKLDAAQADSAMLNLALQALDSVNDRAHDTALIIHVVDKKRSYFRARG